MNRANPTPMYRRLLATIALMGLSVGLAATLTQCRMVTDELSGARMAKAESATSCIARCARAFNDSIRVESDLHVGYVHACDGDSACLAIEEARHEAAVARIQLGRKKCQDDCHHQGGGSGGR